MGVDIPVDGVKSILKCQVEWEKNCIKRCSSEYLHKRQVVTYTCWATLKFILFSYRNQQKKAKKARHEAEKSYMEALAGVGNETGEYVGDGKGETVTVADNTAVAEDLVDADSDVDDPLAEDEIGKPLLIMYDCETTGFSIYKEHILEIAAEVLQCPVAYNSTTFSSLIKTSRRIEAKGILILKSVE